jgi:hypothetical protein
MSRFRTGKRKKQRTKMVVPVRVRLTRPKDSHTPQMAHTLDATENGVRLAGFRGEVSVGDAIEIQHQHKRAMFRVVWIQALGKSSEKQVGAVCMEPDKDIWAVEFPQKPDEYEERE